MVPLPTLLILQPGRRLKAAASRAVAQLKKGWALVQRAMGKGGLLQNPGTHWINGKCIRPVPVTQVGRLIEGKEGQGTGEGSRLEVDIGSEGMGGAGGLRRWGQVTQLRLTSAPASSLRSIGTSVHF